MVVLLPTGESWCHESPNPPCPILIREPLPLKKVAGMIDIFVTTRKYYPSLLSLVRWSCPAPPVRAGSVSS
jgi:hypothetical protein